MSYNSFRSLAGELWLPIPDFPGYDLSNFGRVRSFKDSGGNLMPEPALLRPSFREHDRVKRITISHYGCKKTLIIPYMVLSLFVCPPPDENAVAGFLNGDKTNARVENLFWTTRSNVKLTKADVRAIREIYLTSNPSYGMVAKQYGVHRHTIGDIVTNRTWKHVR